MLKRLNQDDQMFEITLAYIVRSYLKIANQNKIRKVSIMLTNFMGKEIRYTFCGCRCLQGQGVTKNVGPNNCSFIYFSGPVRNKPKA